MAMVMTAAVVVIVTVVMVDALRLGAVTVVMTVIVTASMIMTVIVTAPVVVKFRLRARRRIPVDSRLNDRLLRSRLGGGRGGALAAAARRELGLAAARVRQGERGAVPGGEATVHDALHQRGERLMGGEQLQLREGVGVRDRGAPALLDEEREHAPAARERDVSRHVLHLAPWRTPSREEAHPHRACHASFAALANPTPGAAGR